MSERFTKEEMIRKVAKLLSTAESLANNGNEDAAGSYIAKAHELQQTWSIDQAMLAASGGQVKETITSKVIIIPGKWGRRKVNLAHAIANQTNCTGYYMMGKHYIDRQYRYMCYGYLSDVEHVETLIVSLCQQADVALEQATRTSKGFEHGKSFGAAFYAGFTTQISNRLRQARKAAETSATVTNTGVSLVLVERKKEVQKYMDNSVGKLGRGTITRTNSYNGYSAGHEAGAKATLTKGTISNTKIRGSLGQ